jgi:hypothetical protein
VPGQPDGQVRASASASTTTDWGEVSVPVSSKSRPEASAAVHGHQGSGERPRGALGDIATLGGEGGVDPPPASRTECHPGPLALDHHAGGHALDPAGRQAGHDLLPQDGRDLVAVEAVEDPPGLLGIDQAPVEVTPFETARSMAGRVISWKTIRFTGTLGASTSRRCQAIDSPSRSSSEAR